MSSSLEVIDGAETRHRFDIAEEPVSAGRVRLSATGNYDGPDKTATLTAEAFVLGSAGIPLMETGIPNGKVDAPGFVNGIDDDGGCLHGRGG